MDRREFLKDTARMLLVLPMGTFLLRCGGDDDNVVTVNPTTPDTTPPDAPPQIQGDAVVFTSSVTNLHSHSFAVPLAAFTSPPLTGVAGETTVAQAHTHTLLIPQDALIRAQSGQTVKIPTSETLGHTHVFTIVRVG
jgi:hypothetical protein